MVLALRCLLLSLASLAALHAADDAAKDAGKESATRTDGAAKPESGTAQRRSPKEDPWAGKASPLSAVGATPEAAAAVAAAPAFAALVQTYCAERGLALAEHHGQSVDLLVVGAVKVDASLILDNAELALRGLETWTGEAQLFAPKPMPASQRYQLVLFSDQATRDGLIDRADTIAKDKGLAKQCASVSVPRGSITDARSLPIIKWWAVFSTARVALDAVWLERGVKPPVWLREGLACELQRLVCSNQVKVYSVAYEIGKNQPKLDGDWAKDVAKMIMGRDPLLLSASDTMLLDVVKLPAQHYELMWSLADFVKGAARNQKGPENKLLRLIAETAAGKSSRDAVKDVYQLEDPVLTKTWQAWAPQQR